MADEQTDRLRQRWGVENGGRKINKQIGREKDTQTGGETDIYLVLTLSCAFSGFMERQMDRERERQTDRQTGRETDEQPDRETDIKAFF